MSKYGHRTVNWFESIVNKLGGEEAAEKFLSGKLIVSEPEQPPLFAHVTTVQVQGAEKFCAKDCLKEANVGWAGDNFKKLFLKKEEQNVPDVTLVVNRLQRWSLDAPILAELGEKAETSLAYMFDLLKKQAHGEDGVLLTNGYANIFYVRGTDGNLWAVYCSWYSDDHCWRVGANSVGSPNGWNDGCQVFSRNS